MQRRAAREGAALLAISSGSARPTTSPDYSAEPVKGYEVTPPTGFPKSQASCPAVSSQGRDGIGLAVTLEVPEGVSAMRFDYAFFTHDYPDWVCTTALDQAVGLLTVAGGGSAQNVLLDGSGNPMFASPSSVSACSPSTGFTCPLGTASLVETGMTASSGWLTVSVSVDPGDTIEVVFAIWDSLDGFLDSTLLLDDFAWVP